MRAKQERTPDLTPEQQCARLAELLKEKARQNKTAFPASDGQRACGLSTNRLLIAQRTMSRLALEFILHSMWTCFGMQFKQSPTVMPVCEQPTNYKTCS